MRREIEIKWPVFLLLSFIYSLLSFIGFVFTSSGWTAFLIEGMGGLALFGINFVVLSIAVILKQPKHLKISIKSLVILLAIQVIAYLLNVGDYGDNSGGRSFFEVLLGRSYFSCHGNDCIRPPLLGEFAGLLALVGIASYLVTLIIFQVEVLKKKE